MKNFRTFSKKLINNKSGQGATEYILLLVVVVAVVLLFKDQISQQLKGKLSELSTAIGRVTPD